jgi:general secretion pathway protein H
MGHNGRQVLLAITAIAGAMIGVLPPYMDQAMARYHARSAADDVVDALNEGRAMAVGRARMVRVVVDEDLRSISVEGGRWRKLSSGIALSGPKQGAIVFRPDGSSTGGQVVVSQHSRAVSILVDQPTGRVRWIEAAG